LSDEAPALPPALDPQLEEARRILPRGRNFH
jgi:hypothetical protein